MPNRHDPADGTSNAKDLMANFAIFSDWPKIPRGKLQENPRDKALGRRRVKSTQGLQQHRHKVRNIWFKGKIIDGIIDYTFKSAELEEMSLKLHQTLSVPVPPSTNKRKIKKKRNDWVQLFENISESNWRGTFNDFFLLFITNVCFNVDGIHASYFHFCTVLSFQKVLSGSGRETRR